MRPGWVTVSAAATAGLLALGMLSPRRGGAVWDDRGGAGHSTLIHHLAGDRPVRAVESPLVLLPEEAGDGDVPFLIPRRPSAVDRQNAAPEALAPGVKYQGLPALLPADQTLSCVPAKVAIGTDSFCACQPAPTAFPDLDRLTDGRVEFSHVIHSDVPVFPNTDLDETFSRGDQGPAPSPVVPEWEVET